MKIAKSHVGRTVKDLHQLKRATGVIILVYLLALSSAVIPSSFGSFGDLEGDITIEETIGDMNTEFQNMQLAVASMMLDQNVSVLDGAAAYDEVDTLAEVQAVTCNGGAVSLDQFLTAGSYPLSQAYDIALDGTVAVD